MRTTVTISLRNVPVYTRVAIAGVVCSVLAQQQRWVLVITAWGEMWCPFERQLSLLDGNTRAIFLSTWQWTLLSSPCKLLSKTNQNWRKRLEKPVQMWIRARECPLWDPTSLNIICWCSPENPCVFSCSPWWHQLNWVLQLKDRKAVFKKNLKNPLGTLCTQAFSRTNKICFLCGIISSTVGTRSSVTVKLSLPSFAFLLRKWKQKKVTGSPKISSSTSS